MNRQQRRALERLRDPAVARAMKVPIDVWYPSEGTTDQQAHMQVVLFRIERNIAETGHPFHHKTASGVIVDDDPTLRHDIKELEKTAKPTTPIDRNWYGVNPYPDV